MQPCRLVQKDQGFIHWKIIQKGCCLIIEIPDHTVHIGTSKRKLKGFLNLLIEMFQIGCRLRFSFFLKYPSALIYILFNPVQAFLYSCFRKNHFRCRIYGNFFVTLNGTLAVHIKAADRINFIIPEFNSIRAVICQIINIKNTSPHRKLSGTLHLNRPLKSHIGQTFDQIRLIHNAFFPQPDHLLFQFLQRKQTVHQAVNRRNDRHRLMLQQFLNNRQTLTHQRLPMHIGTVKNNISRRIIVYILIKKAVILVNILYSFLTVGHN